MIRDPRSTEVQHVVVLRTVHAERADKRRVPTPSQVPVTTATIVSAQPLPDEAAARAWLGRLDPGEETQGAFVSLNKLLAAHRIAAADPYTHEVAPGQALAIRAGFGVGEQVAEGRWLQTRELPLPRPGRWRRGRRATVLRSQERLARLLSSRRGALLCEEFALRARLDLDNGRLAHAASELERGLAAALVELKGEPGQGLVSRLDELRELLPGVQEVAAQLLAPAPAPEAHQDSFEETLSHALGRLEAALRAHAVALAWR
jgi:hypothetical protein